MEKLKSVPINALAKISQRPAIRSTEQAVRERMVRLAELIRKDGAAYPLTPILVNTWVEVFADLKPGQVDAAFSEAERSLKSFWPSPGEVRAFISTAETNAVEEEAAQKWLKVLDYAVRRSPDIREKNPPRISEHTRRAINHAGSLDWIRDCPAKELQWARTRFIEEYIRYAELKQDEHLLPDGEVKNLLADAAQAKALPVPKVSFEELHRRGLAHAKELKSDPAQQPDLKRALCAIRRLAETPSVVDVEGRTAELERQKKFILQKYAKPVEVSA
jgi:hypothetical protein